MKDLMVFEGNNVEVFELDGQVLFNPYHVGECLEIADVKSSIRDFNENQIVKVVNSEVHTMHFRNLNNAGENFLTESGVYKLIFKSRKPNAEKFQDWVTDEVLPSIRKTGSYSVDLNNNKHSLSNTFDDTLKLAKIFNLKGNQALLSANKAVKKLTNIDCMQLLEIKGLENEDKEQFFTPTVIGKKVGLSAMKVNQKLKKKGLQKEERDHSNRIIWNITDLGKKYCSMLDTNKKFSNGTPILQIKWSENVLDFIN